METDEPPDPKYHIYPINGYSIGISQNGVSDFILLNGTKYNPAEIFKKQCSYESEKDPRFKFYQQIIDDLEFLRTLESHHSSFIPEALLIRSGNRLKKNLKQTIS